MSGTTFNPATDIPDLSGKVFLITGGTAGLGSNTIEALSKRNPARVFFTGRNAKAANALIEKVKGDSPNAKVDFIECDQTSLASVHEAANKFLARSKRLDVLMCNAGIMAVDASTTKEGYEVQFAVNHVAHSLLTKLLLPTMLATAKEPNADVRIINMSSIAYKQAPSNGIDFSSIRTPQASLGGMIPGGRWSRYGQSKLANMLYADELAKQYPEITTVSVHPGFIKTGLFDSVPFLTKLPVLLMQAGNFTEVHEGHFTQTWAATCPKDQLTSGKYYVPVGVEGKRETKGSKNIELAKELWDWTERELASY